MSHIPQDAARRLVDKLVAAAPHPPIAQPQAADVVCWWNGFHEDTALASYSSCEDTRHDIPLYAGWNEASETVTTLRSRIAQLEPQAAGWRPAAAPSAPAPAEVKMPEPVAYAIMAWGSVLRLVVRADVADELASSRRQMDPAANVHTVPLYSAAYAAAREAAERERVQADAERWRVEMLAALREVSVAKAQAEEALERMRGVLESLGAEGGPLMTALIIECERAMRQRDEFLRTGISTAGHGGSHDTCFGTIVRNALAAARAEHELGGKA